MSKCIGFILVEEASLEKATLQNKTYVNALKRSYDTFGGRRTLVNKNLFGEWCVSDADNIAKPQIWKTREAAERNATKWNTRVRGEGRAYGMSTVTVCPIHRNGRELRKWVRDAIVDYDNLRDVVELLEKT